MDPLLRLKLAARRLAIVESDGFRCVYQLRRVDPFDLLKAGLAEIPGLAEVAMAGDDALQSIDRTARLNDCASDDERARVAAELEAQARDLLQRQIAAVSSTPEGVAAFFERCGAFLSLGVDAVGIARDELLPETDDEPARPIPVGLVDPDLGPADVCVPFSLVEGGAEDQLLRPVRLVREVTGKDQMAIADLGPTVALELAVLVAGAFGGGGKVARTFRQQPGAGGAPGRVGPAVRAAALGVPGPDPGAGGGGDRGPRGGKARGRKASAGGRP